jgi:hypothetical protein
VARHRLFEGHAVGRGLPAQRLEAPLGQLAPGHLVADARDLGAQPGLALLRHAPFGLRRVEDALRFEADRLAKFVEGRYRRAK